MFCEKCGKEIEDGSVFCPYCGGQANGGGQTNAGNAAPPVDYGTSYAAAKKPVPLKYILIPTIILAVAAIVVTVLILVLKPGDKGNAGNNTSPGYSQPGGTGGTGGAGTNIGGGFGSSPITPSQTNSGNVVTLNGAAVEGAEFAYTYDAAYGHYFATAFSDSGETVMFMAVLPERLCVNGAAYSGNAVSANGIIFDIIVSGADYAVEYNSVDNPELFSELSVSISSIELYQSARFTISGTVTNNGSVRITASGQSAYKVSTTAGGSGTGGTGGTGGADANVCYSCGGTGKCNICHGSGICQVCFGRGGMSVTTYGVAGADDWVECEGCHGNRTCKYCSGGLCGSCGGSGRR